ncbi:hypothetical protein BMMON2_28310 [Burkholderia mallei]
MLPIPPREDRAASVPASFAQTRLWLHARLLGESAAYHITERLRLDGGLDANALRLSCDALIARHEALRTTFAEGAAGVLQTVHAPMRCPWRFTDLADASAGSREQRAAAIAERDEAEPFDLAHGPLVRAHLIRLDAATHWFVLTTHHIVSDGWSADVMLAELSSFYRSYATGDAVSLAPLPVQYADYALWQRRWLDAGEGERQLAYWRATLDASRDALLLPGAATRPAQRGASGARHAFDISAELARRMRALAQARRATPFAVLLAALATLLARASGETGIRIGVPSANRERGETVGLIGFFVNTLTLAASTPATLAFDALVDATQRGLIDAQSHQDVPFDQVVDALGVARSASHHPLFQVMAAYGAARAAVVRRGARDRAALGHAVCEIRSRAQLRRARRRRARRALRLCDRSVRRRRDRALRRALRRAARARARHARRGDRRSAMAARSGAPPARRVERADARLHRARVAGARRRRRGGAPRTRRPSRRRAVRPGP